MRSYTCTYAHTHHTEREQSGALLFPTGNGFKVLVFCHICDINSFAFNVPYCTVLFRPKAGFRSLWYVHTLYTSLYAMNTLLLLLLLRSQNYNCSEFTLLMFFCTFFRSHDSFYPQTIFGFFIWIYQKYTQFIWIKFTLCKHESANDRNQCRKSEKHANRKIVAIKYQK